MPLYNVNDNYNTPNWVWDCVKKYIPNKKIWEPFYSDGSSGEYLHSLGFDVIHDDLDFFSNDKGEIVVSNPPFSKSKKILERLKQLDKPFMLVLPESRLGRKYMCDLFKDEIQIIILPYRINFIKTDNSKSQSPFHCFIYCWKIGLERDMVFVQRL